MKSGRLGITLIGGLIALALLLAVLGPKLVERKPAPPGNGQEAVVSVTAKGVLESADDVELTSQIKSTVKQVLVAEGEKVAKGQLLMEFDSAKVAAQRKQAVAAISSAEARYRESLTGFRAEDIAMATSAKDRATAVFNQARDDYERQRRLFDRGATTQVDLNLAEERMRIAAGELAGAEANAAKHAKGARNEEKEQTRAEVAKVRADLQYIDGLLRDYSVFAPVAGIVAERHKDAGEGVDIGSPLMRIIDPASMRIRAELEETEIGRVREGQPVEATVDAFPNKTFKGRVTKAFPIVQKKTQKSFDPTATFDINTQKIHIALDDYSGLKNGMTVTVRFK